MDKELLEILNQVFDFEMKNFQDDGVDEDFRQGASFGMRFMMKIISDCLNGDSEIVKEVYSD